MKLRVLGCSGAVMPGYDVTSFLINDDTLMDAGTVTSVLTLEEQAKIKNVLITHLHLDHVKDLFFLADNLIGKVTDSINIYSINEVLEGLRTHILNKTIWPDFAALPNEDRPVLRFVSIKDKETIAVGGLKIIPVRVNHTVDAVGYILEDEGGCILYTGDTGPTEAIWEVGRRKEKLKGVFVDTSFPSRMGKLAKITGHHTPATLNEDLKKLGRNDIPIYISHIKPQFREEIINEFEAINNPSITILKGGEEFIF